MTDLSPAAQAVLDAYLTGYGWLDGPMQKDYQCVAAVLRVAADQVLAAQWEGRIEPDAAYSIGINWTRDALFVIAAELEGQND